MTLQLEQVNNVVLVGHDYHVTCDGQEYILDGGMVDTLYAAGDHGPLDDGDCPSKGGRDVMIKMGLMERIENPWSTKITDLGLAVWQLIKNRKP